MRFPPIVTGLALGAVLTLTGNATPLLPGDILVSSAPNLDPGTIREYTPTGLLVQTFAVPATGEATGYNRDIAVDSLGRIEVYNGTFTPALTTMTPGILPGSATSVNNTLAGWSTINNTDYGGIAVGGNYAYATDMVTANGGEPNGVVRFDLTTSQAVRFGQGTVNSNGDYIDLNLGLDGRLYALYPGGSPQGYLMDEFDPHTMTLLRTLSLGGDLGSIAVDAAGNIFVDSPFNGGLIVRYNSNGVQTGSLATGKGSLRDLDISSDGRLLALSSNGDVILTDTSLSSMTSFNVGSNITNFGAFVPLSVPEPRISILLLLAGVIGVLRCCQKEGRLRG